MTEVKLSYEGIGEMLRTPEMIAHMHSRAERIAEVARATAPEDSGDYKAGFKVHSGVREDGRAEATVTDDMVYSAAIERSNYRTRKPTIRAHDTLGKALDAAKD